jgi:hypothetical protein
MKVTVWNNRVGPVFIDNARQIVGGETVTVTSTPLVRRLIAEQLLSVKDESLTSIDDGSLDSSALRFEGTTETDHVAPASQPKAATISNRRRRRKPPVKE